MASQIDKYSQFAYAEVPLIAAATGYEVKQLQTGVTNLQKVAWAVHRVEFFMDITGLNTRLIVAENFLTAAWTQSNTAAYQTLFERSFMLDAIMLKAMHTPAALGEWNVEMPLFHEFGTEPRLFLPQNLFLTVSWAFNAAAAATQIVKSRIWYREVELSEADWYDLLQLRLPLGAA